MSTLTLIIKQLSAEMLEKQALARLAVLIEQMKEIEELTNFEVNQPIDKPITW